MSQRANGSDVEQTARILEKSLKSTIDGLSLLVRSLEASGIEKATPGYAQLQAVLVQQRLWARNHEQSHLDPLWRKIGEQANRIHGLLNPLTQIMVQLRAIETVTEAPETDQKRTEKSPSESIAQTQAKEENSDRRSVTEKDATGKCE